MRKRVITPAEQAIVTMGGRWRGRYGTAKCPCCNDDRPSLTLTHGGEDGIPFRWRCEVGCDQNAIKAALEKLGILARSEADTAFAACEDLAKEPDILDVFHRAMEAAGVVGERRLVILIYLILTTRLLSRPVSLALKGPSSVGKSYLVDQVAKGGFPPMAFYGLTAMSEKALVYSSEPLKHRTIIMFETQGLGQTAMYFMRSLLSEGCIRYETTIKTSDGFQTVHIYRDGPTNLITTTTATFIHAENETRLISVVVKDTPEQTRAIMRAQASPNLQALDTQKWHALQTWLSMMPADVIVPYADTLADLIAPVAVRLRRDFPTVLSLIKGHALLHQFNRKRNEEGKIVAAIRDYGAVYNLVADLIEEGVEATVPATVRRTVRAVADLNKEKGPVSLTMLATRLNLDKSATSRRVAQAIERGLLKNLEEKQGRAARLVLDEPMPEEIAVLPTVAQLRASVKKEKARNL